MLHLLFQLLSTVWPSRLARGPARLDVFFLRGTFTRILSHALNALADHILLVALGHPISFHLPIVLAKELGLKGVRTELADDVICFEQTLLCACGLEHC